MLKDSGPPPEFLELGAHGLTSAESGRDFYKDLFGEFGSFDHVSTFDIADKLYDLGNDGASISDASLNGAEMVLLDDSLSHTSQELDWALNIRQAVASLVDLRANMTVSKCKGVGSIFASAEVVL